MQVQMENGKKRMFWYQEEKEVEEIAQVNVNGVPMNTCEFEKACKTFLTNHEVEIYTTQSSRYMSGWMVLYMSVRIRNCDTGERDLLQVFDFVNYKPLENGFEIIKEVITVK